MNRQNFSEEDIKKVAKGTGFTLFGSSIGKGLFFLCQIILARYLGTEAFGLYSVGFAVVKICEIIARLGLNTGGMRFVSIYKDENASKLKGVLISATGISLLNGFFISFILYFFSHIIAQKVFKKPELAGTLQLFAFSIPFLGGTMVVSSLLQGFHTTKHSVYTREFIQPVINIVLVIILYYAGFGLHGVIYAFIFSNVLSLAAGIFYFKKLFPGFIKREIKPAYELKSLISYSVPLLFVGFLTYIVSWIDTIMLGSFGSAKDVGLYRAASQIPFILTLFLTAANSIYAPLAADLFQKGEMRRLSNILKATTRWVSYTVIPIFIFIVFSADDVMMLFGKEYTGVSSIVLIILAFGQLVNCITGGVGFTLTMTGKQNIALLYSIALILLNIVLNIILIFKYGVVGVAIATAIAVTSINIARAVAVYMIFKIHPFSRELIRYLMPIGISSGLIWGMNTTLGMRTNFLMNGAIICFVFGLFFVFLIKNRAEDVFVFDMIKGKLGKLSPLK